MCPNKKAVLHLCLLVLCCHGDVQVEEMVLSKLAWVSDSPLFDAIEAAGSVPPYRDVALPTVAGVGRSTASPLLHPRLLKLGAKISESPLSALHDRHISPAPTARRALFSPGGSVRSSPIPIAPKPRGVIVQQLPKTQLGFQSPSRSGGSPPKKVLDSGSSSPQASLHNQTTPTKSSPLALGVSDPMSLAATVLSPSKGPSSTTPGSKRPLIPTSPPIPSVAVTQTTPLKGHLGATPGVTSPKPKRTGSLALFYRKMYQLAFIRIKDLCERLGLPSDFTQK